MATWDFILAYEQDAADWLTEQGFPHPRVRTGNRLPVLSEVEDASTALQIPSNAPLLVDCSTDGSRFAMRGDLVLELQLLRKLCEQCGQLWMYPGTGSPAIIVDATTDPEKAASLWKQSDNQPDRWRWFYERMYDDYD